MISYPKHRCLYKVHCSKVLSSVEGYSAYRVHLATSVIKRGQGASHVHQASSLQGIRISVYHALKITLSRMI